MIEYAGHLDVPVSNEIAFEKLADMTELDRWNPNVTTSRRISGDRFDVGSRYVSTIKRGPLRMTARSTLIAIDPGRSVTYEGPISGMWSIDSLGFEPRGAGTRITFHNRTRLPGWLRPLSPILNAAFQPQAQKAVDGARRYLERLAPDT